MEKQEDNYTAPNFATLDYAMDQQYHHHHNRHESTNYLLNNLPQHQHQHQHQQLSFADVMNFADFGPKLALNQTRICEEEEDDDNNNNGQSSAGMIDPVYFLKFPVLNDDRNNDNRSDRHQALVVPQPDHDVEERLFRSSSSMIGKAKEVFRDQENDQDELEDEFEEDDHDHDDLDMSSVQLQFVVGEGVDDHDDDQKKNENSMGNPSSSEPSNNKNNKNKRKRPRTLKTSEEVESQRMTHIAVERNRRKQMNEHLRVLRSLMPGSYVQRGDQASIIGGAIEFVRELEQLLQCLESQKRRRLLGDQTPPSNSAPPFFPVPAPDQEELSSPFEGAGAGGGGGGLREEMAESKSCVADVEVRLIGFDAMIKILSRRRPGQLVKAIAALEDLHFNVLHTNITTIEQTVLYSFNVKVTSESRFSAEDIASSVQQIFSFIHASTTTM